MSSNGRSSRSTSAHASANSVGDFIGDDADAVFVGVDQVAGLDLDAGQLYRHSEIDEPHVSVADARVAPEQAESQRLNLVQVAGATIGDVADAPELLVDRRVDLAELRPQTGGLVHVLAHGDLRTGQLRDVTEVIRRSVGLHRLGPIGASPRRDGITNDRANTWQQAADHVWQEAQVPPPHIENLDRVGDGRRVVTPEGLDLIGREDGHLRLLCLFEAPRNGDSRPSRSRMRDYEQSVGDHQNLSTRLLSGFYPTDIICPAWSGLGSRGTSSGVRNDQRIRRS